MRDYLLSPAPQAVGFSSGLSAAPQADPQAVGFFSGLSAAPQADVEAPISVLPHPDRLESAITISSLKESGRFLPLSALYEMAKASSSTHFFVTTEALCPVLIRPLKKAFLLSTKPSGGIQAVRREEPLAELPLSKLPDSLTLDACCIMIAMQHEKMKQ